ncbi:hypothetical protein GGF40_001492 [Coemansia sp. RSA 1286]|nr:hypothetical protein GGF40_001492 [Coemansia sp. RSA 1286]
MLFKALVSAQEIHDEQIPRPITDFVTDLSLIKNPSIFADNLTNSPEPIESSTDHSESPTGAMGIDSEDITSDSTPTTSSDDIQIGTALMETYTGPSDTESSDTESNDISDYTPDSDSASESTDTNNNNTNTKNNKGTPASTIGLAAGISAGIVVLAVGIIAYILIQRERRRRRIARADARNSDEEDRMESIYAIGGASEPLSPVNVSADNNVITGSISRQITEPQVVHAQDDGQAIGEVDLNELPPQYQDLPYTGVSRRVFGKDDEKEKE